MKLLRPVLLSMSSFAAAAVGAALAASLTGAWHWEGVSDDGLIGYRLELSGGALHLDYLESRPTSIDREDAESRRFVRGYFKIRGRYFPTPRRDWLHGALRTPARRSLPERAGEHRTVVQRITFLSIPLWMALGAGLVYPAIVIGRRRHATRRMARYRREGRCVECGYDLRGNATGHCPECGQTFDRSAQPAGSTLDARPAPLP